MDNHRLSYSILFTYSGILGIYPKQKAGGSLFEPESIVRRKRGNPPFMLNHSKTHIQVIWPYVLCTDNETQQASLMQSAYNPDTQFLRAMYERYGAMLFSILIDVCHSRTAAEKVMIQTFENLADHKSTLRNGQLNFPALIRFALGIARNEGCAGNIGLMKSFHEYPVLHRLLTAIETPDRFCEQAPGERIEIAKQLHLERKTLGNMHKLVPIYKTKQL